MSIGTLWKKENAFSDIFSWVFTSALTVWCARRYRLYRSHQVGVICASTYTLLYLCAWIIFPLENKPWRQVRAEHARWFPHIRSDQPRMADVLRYIVQFIAILLISPRKATFFSSVFRQSQRLFFPISNFLNKLFNDQHLENHLAQERPSAGRRFLQIILLIVSAIIGIVIVTQPLNVEGQLFFMASLWCVAIIIKQLQGHMATRILILLSLLVSCRYLWWRYTSTLDWNDSVSQFFGLLLLGAETYAWIVLVLGYFQTIWPLHRQPEPLPKDTASWPTVDLMIPTYNEDLSVVQPTVYAALGIDWPKEKLNIYLLDDGGRAEFQEFAAQVGIHYIARKEHNHAKAGNINHALSLSHGELVAIFDCDHIPARSFLQLTVGCFLKERRLGVVQTPHHFFSPDPFERNLKNFRQVPNEGTLFYGLVQDGNDTWDGTFFCGSCAVLRRQALEEVGGIAVETVTEDAHTSLRMHRHGYTSAYIRIPQAAGLATESLSAHIGQRIRWARGMAQIFRIDNPLLGKGLKLGQRLCYLNAMLHFLVGIPRLIFLTAPLAFLIFHAYIIYAPATLLIVFVLPHIMHANLTNSHLQGKYRHSFWSEIYETVLAWYIARPTMLALIDPKEGKFNVTAKGGLVDESYVDWVISRPYAFLVMLNMIGLCFGAWRLYYGPENEISTVLISLAWVFYNMLIFGGAAAVAIEAKQQRRSHRVEFSMPAILLTEQGYTIPCVLDDYSVGGVGIQLRHRSSLNNGDIVTLLLQRGTNEYTFRCRIMRSEGKRLGLSLEALSRQDQINFIQCTFARADTWARWQNNFPQDNLLRSLRQLILLGVYGYRRMIDYMPPIFSHVLQFINFIATWIVSFMPRRIDGRTSPHFTHSQTSD